MGQQYVTMAVKFVLAVNFAVWKSNGWWIFVMNNLHNVICLLDYFVVHVEKSSKKY
jgi:hypothetical protein